MNIFNRSLISILSLALLALSGCDSSSETIVEDTTTEEVVQRTIYLLSNAAGTNSVLAYTRDSSGALTFSSETPTGGSGSGDNLRSSGNSIVLDTTTGLLYCVNAGSNSISLFLVANDGSLTLLDTQNSRGVRPVSLAVNYNVVYVLNAGDADTTPNIAGFQVSEGALYFIESSDQELASLDAAPSQIEFSPAGTVLAISESGTGQLTSFVLDSNGAAYSPLSTASGAGPAGLDFTPGGVLVCAEQNPGVDDAGSVSSFSLNAVGEFSAITISSASAQTATSGVRVLASGLNAVVSNSGSDTVSWCAIGSDGQLSFVGANFAAGGEPTELAVSENEEYLYVLNRSSDSISAYQIDESGSDLTALSGADGLPAHAVGLTGW